MDQALPPPVGLRDYVAILQRRRWVVIFTIVVAVAVSSVLSAVATPIYATTSRVIVRNPTEVFANEGEQGVSNFIPPDRKLQTAVRQLRTEDFERSVLDTLVLPTPVESISISAASNADVIEITVSSEDPVTAQLVADAYAQAYVDEERSSGAEALLAQSSELRSRAELINGQLGDLDVRLTEAEANGTGVAALTAERQTLALQYQDFISRADELEVNADLRAASGSRVTASELPTSPSSPKPLQSLLIAAFLGLLAGLGLAFVVDVLDDRVKTIVEIQRVGGRARVIATIPRTDDLASTAPPLPVDARPDGPSAEAFRGLRASLQFLRLDNDIKTVMVTSAMPGEGKTTVVANLAASAAQVGQRVVVLDCDVRRPSVAERFGIKSPSIGIGSVLAGETPLSEVLVDVPLRSGGTVTYASFGKFADPMQLLSSPRFARLLEWLAERYGLVIIDTSPVVPVSDSLPIARVVDAVLMVVAYRSTGRAQLTKGMDQILLADPPHLMQVVTKVTGEEAGYGGYGYGTTGEGADPKAGKGRRGRKKAEPAKARSKAASKSKAAKAPRPQQVG